MTIDEAIKNEMGAYENLSHPLADADERHCAYYHRQLADWLKELKDLREENKVLMQECDRLIKEKWGGED